MTLSLFNLCVDMRKGNPRLQPSQIGYVEVVLDLEAVYLN
jgi:hypothetical protein